ncbi:TRAP transporter substrate-binding protein [Pseudopelagicola sp. nBUS_20]|uniref:TRAP transporter substrate-binding protein n=1 Tax=Pseudopelagicola sp. nBUS_20 TaxID=3395317 RepID=UPI003EC0D118
MTKRKTLKGLLAGAAFAFSLPLAANAAEHTFNLQSFLPAQATIPSKIIDVWADEVEKASGGRIEIKRFASMQLGGKPPDLIDQVIDGVIDITWNVVGYTPGRFPSTEVFELPFLVTDARAASSAFWQMMQTHMEATEFKDVKMLGVWVHGPGVIHSADPVNTPADFNGMKIRGASRQVNALLKQLGATPVGMPVPAVPEALSKKVIDGTTIPWEVTKALKVPELVSNHTEFTGPMMYTVTFVLVMNKDKYNSLPDDLKAVMNENSGIKFSVFAGGTQQDYDDPSRQLAVERGNNIITLDVEQSAEWAASAAPVQAAWVEEMKGKGIDGQALIDEAKKLMADYK